MSGYEEWRAVVKTVMNLRGSTNYWEILATGGFSRRAQLHEILCCRRVHHVLSPRPTMLRVLLVLSFRPCRNVATSIEHMRPLQKGTRSTCFSSCKLQQDLSERPTDRLDILSSWLLDWLKKSHSEWTTCCWFSAWLNNWLRGWLNDWLP
jgi:hypothetical protein